MNELTKHQRRFLKTGNFYRPSSNYHERYKKTGNPYTSGTHADAFDALMEGEWSSKKEFISTQTRKCAETVWSTAIKEGTLVKRQGKWVSFAEHADEYRTAEPSARGTATRERIEPSPHLFLVDLRIKIENGLRALAEKHRIAEHYTLSQLYRVLRGYGILRDASFSDLPKLIKAGNQAAHGGKVEDSVATWAMEHGPKILAALDSKLRE